MSREIEFRVYIKPLKRYATGYETILYHHQCNMEPSWTVNISPEEYYGDEELIIEQFTGLLDRNGKKIYEGDILEFGIAGAENRGVVGYEKDFGSYVTYTSEGYIIASLFTSRGKIIGNIHENKEFIDD